MDEKLTQALAELTNAVKSNGGTTGLNKDELVTEMTKLLDEQRRQILENTPLRPGEFQGEAANKAADAYQGRYQTELKDITRKGVHAIGSWKLRGSDLYLSKLMLDKAHQFDPKVKPASEDLTNAVKALTSTGTGTGDELVPTGMATEMWQDFFAASRIANDLSSQPMPTDPFDIPLGFGTRTWRKGTQGLASSAADTATAKVTLTSTEQVTEDNWTYNLDEDSVIAMMPALRQNLTLTGGEQMDAFCLNADATATSTGNINNDDGVPDSDSYYLTDGADGIRHYALVDKTAQAVSMGAAMTDAGMTAMLARLGKYGLDIANVRIVPDVATYISLLGMTNVATFDKYGPQATIVTGELAKYRGYSVIPSASMPLTEADGKASKTAASNTLGGVLSYNRNFWRVGFRRGLLIEIDRLIQRRMLIMVTSFRIAINCHGVRTSLGEKHTALQYNATV